MTTLITAANKGYMDRITPYLHTIQEHGGAFDERVLITVGCRIAMPDELSALSHVGLPLSQARGHTGNYCIQQGCFLDAVCVPDDEVLIFTDGDVRMQRAPSDTELAWLRAVPPHTIALAWNAGPHDTLADEATRIGLTPEGKRLFAPLLHHKVYNVGVIVCRAAAYRAIYARYMELWEAFIPHTAHYAANQFLLCAVVAELGLLVWEMHPTMHTHGCFGLPNWAQDDGGTLMVDGTPVLFRHHWGC